MDTPANTPARHVPQGKNIPLYAPQRRVRSCNPPGVRSGRSGSGGLAASLGMSPLAHQALPLHARGGKVAFLHVAKTLDLFWDASDLERQRMVRYRQRRQHLFDAGTVLANQRTLGSAL